MTAEALKWEDASLMKKCKVDICELSDELFSAIGDYAPKYCRVVEVLLTPWNTGKKIIALTPTCLFVFDPEGHMERFMRLNEIKKIERMEGEVSLGLRGKDNRVQFLFKTPEGQKDLLFHMIRDHKNISEEDDILDILNQITTQVFGMAIPVEEIEPTEPLEGRADLKSEHPTPDEHFANVGDCGMVSLDAVSSSDSSSSSAPDTPSGSPSVRSSIAPPPTPPVVATPVAAPSKQPVERSAGQSSSSASPKPEPPAVRTPTPEPTPIPTAVPTPVPTPPSVPAKLSTSVKVEDPKDVPKTGRKSSPKRKMKKKQKTPAPTEPHRVRMEHLAPTTAALPPPAGRSHPQPAEAVHQIKYLQKRVNDIDYGRETQITNLTQKLNEVEHVLECMSPRSTAALNRTCDMSPTSPPPRQQQTEGLKPIPMDSSLVYFEVMSEGQQEPYYWHVSSGAVQWNRPDDPKVCILPHTKDVVRMIVARSKPPPNDTYTMLVAALSDISLAPTAHHLANQLHARDPTLLYSALSDVLPGVAFSTIQREWRFLLNNYVEASVVASKRLRQSKERGL
eukprot:TRINITY_DN535_c7_g1_i1.p1 TRINITY_DN535_c7_g1~~TRINITY_DN535_c7_g1_i1.p1  ORF type:complete len:563 (+),score=114.00 TRINITY_DN535_c7_g1_i1:60-1748(+)